MRVLQVHNYYRLPGGEDEVVREECELLRSHGNEVTQFTKSNTDIETSGPSTKLMLALNTLWSWSSAKEISAQVRRTRPDLVHFHNTFPLLSPSVYTACSELGVPVVKSLHNCRMLCMRSTLYRDGHKCTDCLGQIAQWSGMRHACYRSSTEASITAGVTFALHRQLGTYRHHVDKFLTATEYYRKLFTANGLPSEAVVVKPHSVADRGIGSGSGDYALYLGRLVVEKGVGILLEAWNSISIPLVIRGAGPMLEEVMARAESSQGAIKVVGRLSLDALAQLVKSARFLVVPSEGAYETFGLVIVEAFAAGIPVVVPNVGAPAEIVENGKTGLYFESGDATSLTAAVKWAWANETVLAEMGRNGRAEYLARYTPERNYSLLMSIYASVLAGGRSPLLS